MVSRDEGSVQALKPERVILLPDGDEDIQKDEYFDLVAIDQLVQVFTLNPVGQIEEARFFCKTFLPSFPFVQMEYFLMSLVAIG